MQSNVQEIVEFRNVFDDIAPKKLACYDLESLPTNDWGHLFYLESCTKAKDSLKLYELKNLVLKQCEKLEEDPLRCDLEGLAPPERKYMRGSDCTAWTDFANYWWSGSYKLVCPPEPKRGKISLNLGR